MIRDFFNSFFYNDKYCYFCKENKVYKSYICEDCINNLFEYTNEIINDDEQIYKEILFFYKGILKQKIKEFKFNDCIYLKKPIGKIMYDRLDKSKFNEYDYISYVPSSNRKYRKRGYNHSKLLAEELSSYSKIPLYTNLKKIKNTKSQHFLNMSERRTNLKDSFKAYNDLKGKNIILIDDIYTSGSTINECCKELKKVNCGKIWVICLCSVK